MITVVNQLPLDDRYTAEWLDMFWEHQDFMPLGYSVKKRVVDRSKEYNYFTNLESSIEYETSQIHRLFWQEELTHLLIADLDFPGIAISAVPALRLKYPEVVVGGILHAGSWCTGDIFAHMQGKVIQEESYFELCNFVFVATYYHKMKIEHYFDRQISNLVVLDGLPFNASKLLALRDKEKTGDILVLGREEQMQHLSARLWDAVPEWSVEFHGNGLERVEFLEKLAQYKIAVIPKVEETFGYIALEAAAVGTIPIVPDGKAYQETLTLDHIYSGEVGLIAKLSALYRDADYYEYLSLQTDDLDFEKYRIILDKLYCIMLRTQNNSA